MNVEIVTTGTELLLGEIVDTNAAYIARQLREVGVNLFYKTTVGDNQARLAEVLQHGLIRSDIILVTGGLGPTVDDITREAVAEATGLSLELRDELVTHLRTMFANWGRDLTENNLRQAYLPVGATIVPNPIGTAVGFIVVASDGAIICMPGVPREMKRMMADHVLPYLQERMGDKAGVIRTRLLHVAGVGESAIDDRIAHLMTSGNPTVGLAAHMGQVDVRIAARAGTAEEADALIAPVEAEIRERLARWIYGIDDETLGGVIARRLRQGETTLALLETNTSGRIAAFFREQDHDVMRAVLQVDTVEAAARLLELHDGLHIDEASAQSAAARLRDHAHAGYALVLLGTSDPAEGFWSASRGESWLGLATPAHVYAERFLVGGADEYSAQWLAMNSLSFLRRHLD